MQDAAKDLVNADVEEIGDEQGGVKADEDVGEEKGGVCTETPLPA